MNIWARIGELIADGAEAVGTALAGIRDAVQRITNAEARRQVAFTISMIALSAKMAKADGIVTPDEVEAFQQIFTIPAGEERNVSRIYNLAKSDIAGFEAYAGNVSRLFPDNRPLLEDILDGLFHIAKADGVIHERELSYLGRVSEIFGFTETEFAKISERHAIIAGEGDPYLVLGADSDWDFETLKKHYRKLIAENHPDRLIARGVPEEFIRIATERVSAINSAWETIEKMRGEKMRGEK
jgi:DnaJ like chaperone protein